jgi:V8-like Glu-specific endopeptidase
LEGIRFQIERLLGAAGFDLFPLPSGTDPNIAILQFDGVAREQSPSFLFQTAADLVDALDLVSCVPDVDPGWPADGEDGHGKYSTRDELAAPFQGTRFAAEASWLSFQLKQRRDPTRVDATEVPVAPRSSVQLAEAVRSTGRVPSDLLAVPVVLLSPITPAIGPTAALTLIAGKAGSGESAGAAAESSARSYLKGSGNREVLDLMDRVLAKAIPARDPHPTVTQLREEIRNAAPRVLDGFAKGARSSADFEGVGKLTAEALVRLTGRPALRVVNGAVQSSDPQIGEWRGDILMVANRLRPIIEATGRIDIELGGQLTHVGTGTVVAPGVIMTNRHVIDAFAEPIPMPGGKREFLITASASINFDEKAEAPERRFKITRIITAGPNAIGKHADVSKLDMAFLEVETENDAREPLPGEVKIGGLADGPMSIAIVGYPAKPDFAAMTDPHKGAISDEIADRLWELFQNDYGHKYLSPGAISLGPGAVAGDVRHWAFTHDATTLAGNSGSCVIRLGLNMVCGLHFGGAPMRQNLAHGLIAVRDAAANEPALIDDAVLSGLSWAP